MVNWVWFWIFLLFKLNRTFPLDISTETSSSVQEYEHEAVTELNLEPTYNNCTNKNRFRLNDLEVITSKIIESIRRLKEVRPEVGASTKPKLLDSGLTSDDFDDEITQERDIQNDRGNIKDLKEYEKLVISKKYPYLEIDDVNPKMLSLEPILEPRETRPRSKTQLFEGQGGLNVPEDENRNIEITNRGLSGFEFPMFKCFREKHPSEDKTNQSGDKSKEKALDESIVSQLKNLIYEYENKKKRSGRSFVKNDEV